MNLKVFLSTAITGVTEEEKEKIFEYVISTVRCEYEYLRDTDKIEIISNFDEGPAPVDTRYKKLYHLSRAFEKMSDCDVFFLLREHDDSIKPGCYVELNAWLSAGGVQPIIRSKSLLASLE